MLEAPDKMANPFDDDNDDDVFDDALPSPPDLDLSSLPPPPPPPGDNEHSRLANGGWRHSCRRQEGAAGLSLICFCRSPETADLR